MHCQVAGQNSCPTEQKADVLGVLRLMRGQLNACNPPPPGPPRPAASRQFMPVSATGIVPMQCDLSNSKATIMPHSSCQR